MICYTSEVHMPSKEMIERELKRVENEILLALLNQLTLLNAKKLI